MIYNTANWQVNSDCLVSPVIDMILDDPGSNTKQ